jgi:hypothetical protein
MSETILHQPAGPSSSVISPTKLAVAAALPFWLALVTLLGAGGFFVTPPGTPPLSILIALTVPIVVFLAAFRISRAFRDLVQTADLRFMMAIQAWRFAGLGFLALYAHGVLPGLFAWPAGLGDIAIGVTAPWLLLALIRRPGFAASRTFVAWNVLGILDLAVAVGTGALSGMLALGVDGPSTGPMGQLPLALVPTYFVPIFVMLHIAALIQARRLAKELVRSEGVGRADNFRQGG